MNDTDHHTHEDEQIDERHEIDEDTGARFESIRQLALSGDLETSPENEEIIGALLDTISQRDGHFARMQEIAAELANFQRRAVINEQEARTGATAGVVQAMIPLIDHFEMALGQDPEKVSGDQILGGVRLIRDEFVRALSSYGVAPIAPRVGDEFDPGKHAAMVQQAVEGVEPGRISMVMGTGYMLGDRVVRPAKVAVAPPEETVDDEGGDEGDDDADV